MIFLPELQIGKALALLATSPNVDSATGDLQLAGCLLMCLTNKISHLKTQINGSCKKTLSAAAQLGKTFDRTPCLWQQSWLEGHHGVKCYSCLKQLENGRYKAMFLSHGKELHP